MQPVRNHSSIWLACLSALLAIAIFTQPVFGQEKKAKRTLAFVPSDAQAVFVIRPSKILKSEQFQFIKRTSPKVAKKIIELWTDGFFELSLVELQDIDEIISITRTAQGNVAQNDPSASYQTMILSSKKENSQGFDMVTQDVDETFEKNGKEFFKMGKSNARARQGMQFALVANSKTIIWSNTKFGIEQTVVAASAGPASAEWYKAWSQMSDKPISMVMTNEMLAEAFLPPNLGDLKKVKYIVAGLDVKANVQAIVRAVCTSPDEAKKVEATTNELLQMGKQMLAGQRQMMRQTMGDDSVNDMFNEALNSAKLGTQGSIVQLKAAVKLDLSAMLPALEATVGAADRTTDANKLRQVAISFHNFYDANKGFPSPVMVHPETGVKYSWRIAILPYIEERELYDRYDFSQEWNSPHNLEVTSEMPEAFRSASADPDSTSTSWFLVSGPDGIFDNESSKTFQEITDGTSNTILAVEAKRKTHWAKPEDITLNKENMSSFGGLNEGGFNAAMADGSVQFIPEDIDRELLWKMLTATGGEVFDHNNPAFELPNQNVEEVPTENDR